MQGHRRASVHRAALLLVLAVLLSAACAERGSGPFGVIRPPDGGFDRVDFTDDEIRDLVYSRELRLPPGFYREDRAPGDPAPYYVNTVSIAPPCCRTARWVELSTNDPAQARAWAETTIAYSNIPPVELGATTVTNRFFDVRGATGVPMRAHRASYLDRSGYDRMRIGGPPSTIGTLRARPIDLAAAKGVAEYLWTIDPPNMSWVLSSFGHERREEIVHVIYGVAASFGDWGMCDRLYMQRQEYHVSRVTGDIELRVVPVREIVGRCR